LITAGRRGEVRPVPGVPGVPIVPGDAAGLRAANARLRELVAERDAQAAGLRVLVANLQAQVAELAAPAGQNSKNPSRPSSLDGLGRPVPKSLRKKAGRQAWPAQGAAGHDHGADRSS
jgi:hypothetical protein